MKKTIVNLPLKNLKDYTKSPIIKQKLERANAIISQLENVIL